MLGVHSFCRAVRLGLCVLDSTRWNFFSSISCHFNVGMQMALLSGLCFRYLQSHVFEESREFEFMSGRWDLAHEADIWAWHNASPSLNLSLGHYAHPLSETFYMFWRLSGGNISDTLHTCSRLKRVIQKQRDTEMRPILVVCSSKLFVCTCKNVLG